MSKLIGFTAVAVTAAVAVSIASLVLNIIILTKTNTVKSNTNAIKTTLKVPTNHMPSCAMMGNVSTSQGFSDAAGYLLKGLDESIDPCQDFYAFTCNKYLASIDLDALGLQRKGTYDDSQVLVNTAIANALKGVDYQDQKVSVTERITKHALDSCVATINGSVSDYTKKIVAEINDWFGGVPFTGGALKPNIDLFLIAGTIEQTHALPTLMASFSSVDYQNVKQNALYVSQPQLDMPLDYFTLPQYIDKLKNEQASIFSIMQAYRNATVNDTTINAINDTQLQKFAQDVVNFEVAIAMASWSDSLLRNYKLQYNPYNLASLQQAYPQIKWSNYLNSLLTPTQTSKQVAQNTVVLSQPSYFAWLDSVFNGNIFSKETIANYMIVQLLQDDANYLGANMRALVRQKNYVPYIFRRGRGVRRIGKRHFRKFDDEPPEIGCLDLIMNYMPYGPGYTYVKIQQNRTDVVKDVTQQTEKIISNFQDMMKSLKWMDPESLSMAMNKSNSLIKNYGWPTSLFGNGSFVNSSVIDKYHQDYVDILTYEITDFYSILKVLKRGSEIREIARLLNAADNEIWGNLRNNFLASPAEVNAWYQPERNSITFPYAAWNPPYYRLDFPQAYNFAGQGGTGGHELTHGFDDEGVQFDWDGSMTDCEGKYKCGWMTDSSNDGFTDMAQCVVSQYSSQCCPLKTGNVHCANGATTQGENIADLGGQQAAYFAYRQYIETLGHEELRLPGMSKYTPNQIFWITYGYSWCMKQTDANLVKQLLTNPHAPGSCRVNQVMEDIPQFGVDFNCPQGTPMYPMSDGRCMVWVGY